MNFGKNAARAVVIFSKNAGLIIKVSAVSFLISVLSLGIMMPALFCGMGAMFQKLDRGEKAGFAELFAHIDKTFRLFTLGVIIALASLAGVIFIFLPVLVICLWMYAAFFMACEDMGISESLSMSANAAVQKGFFGSLVSALAIVVLNAAGASLFGLGLIVTLPLTAGFLAFSYEDLKGN
jgi:uncharacterized membrane protein